MPIMTIKVGDDRPWNTTLTSAGDDDLTDVASIAVFMRELNSTSNTINGTAATITTTAVTAALLPVVYSPSTANVSSSGTFSLYWKGTFTTGSKVARWPSKGFDRVIIQPNYE